MFLGILLGMMFFFGMFFGKEILLMLADLPLIGNVAMWYMNFVGPLGESVMANMVYAGMAAQIAILPIAVLMYGPSAVRKVLQKFGGSEKV